VIVGNEGTAGLKVIPAVGAMLVPLRARVCGLSVASSEIVMVAERTPEARGANVTVIVQVELTAMVVLHVGLEELKSLAFVPPRTTLVMCSGAAPEFFTEELRDVLVSCVTVPKSRLPGRSVTAGAAATPVPFRARVCRLPGALSETWRVADSGPVLAGVKVTLTEQLALGARVGVQVLD